MIHENLYKGKIHFARGDQVKKMLLSIAMSCMIAISLISVSPAVEVITPDDQILYSYEGNLSEKKIIPLSLLQIYGPPAFFMAEAVKFQAPKDNWKVSAVTLYCLDGFNGSEESIPMERIIAVEIRDKDKKLLYKFADSQFPYSNYARNISSLNPLTIDIPQIPVSDEFYICFYDRGAVLVGCEPLNDTSENSFVYVEDGYKRALLPASLAESEEASTPINWLMEVSGI